MLAPMPSIEPRNAAAPLPDYDSPQALQVLLQAEGLAMSKRFGQNFLVNRNSRERIMAELKAEAGMRVWEIGPGIGAMTAMALDAGLSVTAFEIDYGFSRLLARLFGDRGSFRLVEGDFLDTWKAELEASGPPDRIFGNLPYNAANAIVAALLEGNLVPPRMLFTVQKEAGLRMTSSPGTKDYSAFSVLCASACRAKLAFDLGSSSFWPAPRVTSTVVRMERRAEPVAGDDRAGFSAFVRALFASRRKTLRNNLRAASGALAPVLGGPVPDEAAAASLASLGIRADVRAEALKPEQLAAVFSALKARGSEGRAS
jgi:16S rRNA (adenine1518-N6/adenine1519-N6)-dimethyltransferase